MTDKIKAMVALLWHRNTVRAEMLMIELCDYLGPQELRHMADYMNNLATSLEQNVKKYRREK